MTDGNTYVINKHLDEREDFDALQEIYAELEQAEARIEELEAKLSESEALLAKAVKFIELAVELVRWDLNPSFRDEMIDFTTELKGQDDE